MQQIERISSGRWAPINNLEVILWELGSNKWELGSNSVDKPGDGLPQLWINWELGSRAGSWAPKIREMGSKEIEDASYASQKVGDGLP